MHLLPSQLAPEQSCLTGRRVCPQLRCDFSTVHHSCVLPSLSLCSFPVSQSRSAHLLEDGAVFCLLTAYTSIHQDARAAGLRLSSGQMNSGSISSSSQSTGECCTHSSLACRPAAKPEAPDHLPRCGGRPIIHALRPVR